jgi:hypothetical protein
LLNIAFFFAYIVQVASSISVYLVTLYIHLPFHTHATQPTHLTLYFNSSQNIQFHSITPESAGSLFGTWTPFSAHTPKFWPRVGFDNRKVAGSCEYGEELSSFINAGNFLTSGKVYWLASQEGLCSME